MNCPFVSTPRPSGLSEYRDCTVRATATATGIEYGIVHAAFAAAGRKNRRGCVIEDLAQKVARLIGVKIVSVKRSGSLRKFLTQFPTGKYIVCKHDHAFAVIDGAVYDSTPQSEASLVKAAWRVE